MQFVKFNYRFFNLKVWWCHFEGKCNTQHFNEFFWQNREKLKYRFLTFLPVTWVKIELQRPTIHQMNGWNLYFLAYFMPSIRKLNLRGPRTSDISLKFIESPFSLKCFITKLVYHPKDLKTSRADSASRIGLANFPTYSFNWSYFFHFQPYSISQFSTLVIYLALFFYEIYSK